ncbi:restriction endonuclease subunit S, partial [Vibrio owensii]
MVPNGWKSRPFGDIVRLSKNKYDPKKSTECLPCIELEHLAQETGQVLGSVPAANLGSIKNRFNAGDV